MDQNTKELVFFNWFNLGLPGRRNPSTTQTSHYAKACTDITFKFPFGEHELEGIAARGNFDLTQHQEHSGKNLEYFDEERKEKYLLMSLNPAWGRSTFLAVLCSAYSVDEIDGEKRTVLRSIQGLPQLKQEFFLL